MFPITMFVEGLSVVGGDDNQGGVVKSLSLYVVEEAPQFTIDIRKLTIVKVHGMVDLRLTSRRYVVVDLFQQVRDVARPPRPLERRSI